MRMHKKKKNKTGDNWKAKCRMHKHAKKRARKRYGLKIGGKTLTYLINLVENKQVHVVRKDPDQRLVCRHSLQRKTVYFVYDPFVHAIVTFLPEK